MEIAKLSENALRLKGKKATLLLDVIDIKKTEANAYLFLREDQQKANGATGLIISGPGDYEIAGVKVSVSKIGKGKYFELLIDGVRLLLANASEVATAKDKITEQQVVVLFADSVIDQSAITNFSPVLLICYGEKADALATSLGKGLGKKSEEGASADADTKPVDKFVFTSEKLPTELQVVLLQ